MVLPATLTDAQRASLDVEYQAGASMTVQTAAMRAYTTTELWADQVSGWELAPGGQTDALSKLVSYRVTFTTQGKPPQTIIGAAALRSE